MKFRFNLLIILLAFGLAACSLAEDITPPPGYSSPTLEATTVPPTQTSLPASPTRTTSPNAPSTEPVAGTTGEATPQAEVSPTLQADKVDIGGRVSLATGGILPGGTLAALLVYNPTLGQVIERLTVRVLADGSYLFSDVQAPMSTIYMVTVDFNEVTYGSVPVQFDGTKFQFDLPVTLYETTNDLNVLTIAQVHLQFDFSTADKVQVMVLYVVTNPGEKAVVVSSDGSNVPFILLPENVEDVKYQLSQNSSSLLNATNGFAMLPGADKQYAIITSFSLPYSRRLEFSQPFNLPVTSATIIVPEGVKVRSDQLTDGGTQASTDATFHLYQSSNLASGSTLTFTISGMPGDKPGFVLDTRTWLMIGVAAVGLVLIGLGIFLFLRDRKLRKMEEDFEDEEEESEEDALGEDRDRIMDAIIALDDQFKAGDISKDGYKKRRDELKDRLKKLA